MRHQAIYTTHPAVTMIDDGLGAFDKEGNKVEINESLVAIELAKLRAAEPLRILRVERDRLLAESDWWASSDLVMSDERKAYRQALRDLPSGLDTEEKVKNVTWPTKPE